VFGLFKNDTAAEAISWRYTNGYKAIFIQINLALNLLKNAQNKVFFEVIDFEGIAMRSFHHVCFSIYFIYSVLIVTHG